MMSFISKFRLERYLSFHFILAIDLCISLFASFFTILLLSLFTNRHPNMTALFTAWLGLSVGGSLFFFWALHTYHAVIRHYSMRDVANLFISILGKELVLGVGIYLVPSLAMSWRWAIAVLILDFLLTLFMLIIIRVAMILVFEFALNREDKKSQQKRALVYGAMEGSLSLAMKFRSSEGYEVVGLLTFGKKFANNKVAGLNVFCFETEDDVKQLIVRHHIDAIFFSSKEDARKEEDRLLNYAVRNELKTLISPPLSEVDGGKVAPSIREIKIEDLLERPEIKISMKEIIQNFQGKTVMVTGGAGSIGAELCRQLAGFGVNKIVLFDNAETPTHNIRLELEESFPTLHFVSVIGDVRMENRLDFAFKSYRPQIVFHAAAYKHVPLMEENPCEAVLVNVVGTRNVANKCIEYGVEKMVMISTDKAVNPTNVMGCTKRLAEIYVQSLGIATENGKHEGITKFVTTRFGNVLGSNGSVIPRFREQLAKGGPLTVTHPEITRFFMTIPEACRLVMEAATMSTGNQIFVFDMGESVKIVNLARKMIELAGMIPERDIKIQFTGLRPGEKLYEEVLSSAENTLPTQHSRIRIAKIREYDYEEAVKVVNQLEKLSREVKIDDTVMLMKATVPEFVSKNSPFEKFDN